MQRWIVSPDGHSLELGEHPTVDAFLNAIETVCRAHGMSILHEHAQGTFIVSRFSDEGMDRLRRANDHTAVTCALVPPFVAGDVDHAAEESGLGFGHG